MQKNFEKFQVFLKTFKFTFSAVCPLETWCDSLDSTKNVKSTLYGYKSFDQTRDGRKGGGLCIFLRNMLSYRIRSDLSMFSDAIQCLSLEISAKKTKNIILSLNYQPPNGN